MLLTTLERAVNALLASNALDAQNSGRIRELEDIFDKTNEDIDDLIDLANKRIYRIVNMYPNDKSKEEGMNRLNKSLKELITETTQYLKQTNYSLISDKNKRHFIFGFICYAYHKFNQEASRYRRNEEHTQRFKAVTEELFADDSIITNEIIDKELLKTLIQKFNTPSEAEKYAVNTKDRLIACAMCDDLYVFFQMPRTDSMPDLKLERLCQAINEAIANANTEYPKCINCSTYFMDIPLQLNYTKGKPTIEKKISYLNAFFSTYLSRCSSADITITDPSGDFNLDFKLVYITTKKEDAYRLTIHGNADTEGIIYVVTLSKTW